MPADFEEVVLATAKVDGLLYELLVPATAIHMDGVVTTPVVRISAVEEDSE